MSNLRERFTDWLDIRPAEARIVTLCLLGALFVMAFVTLARSLREALFLTDFPARNLPYITGAVALLSLPAVGAFTRLLTRHQPGRLLSMLILLIMGGLGVLWPFVTRSPVATVVFYLWTAVGTLLLTSGFWVVVAETFPVRGAKRLFGLISAGGTAGLMIMGVSLNWLTKRLELIWLVPLLAALLVLLLVVMGSLPEVRQRRARAEDLTTAGGVTGVVEAGPALEASAATSTRESLRLIWGSPHLRTIALIVMTATCASTLIDYQFKEYAQAAHTSQAGLAGFFGAFYGWTGGLALAVQLLVTGRIIAATGIATGLAVLPALVLLGSGGVLLAPGFLLLTLLRGTDSALRKSLHRPLLELLYVPLPTLLRRKTKTFVDSVVDSTAEGLGALVVFAWVTLPGLPSRWLSLLVMVLALLFLHLCRRMGKQYYETITARLREEAAGDGEASADARARGRDLLSATFTRLNVAPLLREIRRELASSADGSLPEAVPAPQPLLEPSPGDRLARLRSPEDEVVLQALDETRSWRAEDVPRLMRLLARDALYRQLVAKLVELGDLAIPQLVSTLRDENADFVIRRRIPAVLARTGGPEADAALLDGLVMKRFEIRYRSAIALVRRRRHGLSVGARPWSPRVWHAIRLEVTRDGPLWELQKLLDDSEPDADDLAIQRIGVRGELSLEHTFRMLSLVLDPQEVKAAFQGILARDENLKSLALEYLEHVLPPAIRQRLWLFIGDVSEYRKARELRSLDEVVNDLMSSRATLFAGEQTRAALKRILEERNEDHS